MEHLIIKSLKSGKEYRIDRIKAYNIEQDIDIPADAFEFVVGNNNSEVSNLISAGDFLTFYIDNKKALEGYIDDVRLIYDKIGSDFSINGRDRMAILLDNDEPPANYNNLGLQDLMAKVLPKYGITKYKSDNNTKFKKIAISPGENIYSVFERLAKERGMVVLYDAEGTLRITTLKSGYTPDFHFTDSNYSANPKSIKIMESEITISNDIRNEVIVYGGNYEENKNIKGSYKDPNIKTKKTKIMNESDIEKSSDATKRAKEEFYSINKDAFMVNVNIKTDRPIFINNIAWIQIKKLGLDCKLLITSVSYSKSIENGTITNVEFKLMQNVKVVFKNNDIPLLPKV